MTNKTGSLLSIGAVGIVIIASVISANIASKLNMTPREVKTLICLGQKVVFNMSIFRDIDAYAKTITELADAPKDIDEAAFRSLTIANAKYQVQFIDLVSSLLPVTNANLLNKYAKSAEVLAGAKEENFYALLRENIEAQSLALSAGSYINSIGGDFGYDFINYNIARKEAQNKDITPQELRELTIRLMGKQLSFIKKITIYVRKI